MRNSTRRLVAIFVVGFTFITPIRMALADAEMVAVTDSALFEHLSAEWWQWALSIPTRENPQLDTTGENGVIGQRGSVWFLAGLFNGGTGTRACSVPEGKIIFFPIINSVQINIPHVCGQTGALSVKDLRAGAALIIDAAANLSVTIDGIAIKHLQRIKSEVFAVALPEDNVFVLPCKDLPPVPLAGVYSPAVDDGVYVLLKPLSLGSHTLHFHAESPVGPIFQDVMYNLTVVRVLKK
jgi:hypothetical protein